MMKIEAHMATRKEVSCKNWLVIESLAETELIIAFYACDLFQSLTFCGPLKPGKTQQTIIFLILCLTS